MDFDLFGCSAVVVLHKSFCETKKGRGKGSSEDVALPTINMDFDLDGGSLVVLGVDGVLRKTVCDGET
jgi:hypothetical protein